MADEVAPLGRGEGLLTDIVNFALNNLYQAGQKAKDVNQRRSAIFQQLAQGKKADPSLMSDLTQEAAAVNPVGGVIASTANPILRNLLTVLRERAPKLVGKAEGLAETVYPYLVPRETMPIPNTLGVFRRSRTLPRGDLYVRGGRPQNEQVDTLAHELRHFITGFDPKTVSMRPEHALETAQQITAMLPKAQRNVMQHNYLPSREAAPEILELLPKIPPGGSGPASTAYDESLSYLTEALLGGGQGGDPMLEAVAKALGQGIK